MKHVLRAALAFSLAVLLEAPAAAQTPPVLLTPPVVRINPVTGSGTATIRLQNAQATPLDVVLTAVPPENLPNNARATFAREGAAKPGDLSLSLAIPARSAERIAMAVDGVRTPGDYAIDLYADATKIGTVVARLAPLGLSVDTPPEGQSVMLTGGTKAERVLTNADPFAYLVKWNWSGDGKELCAGENESPANATALLTCTPSVGGLFREVFRQSAVPSVLTLHVDTRPASGQTPLLRRQVIPVTLAPLGPGLGQTIRYVVLVLVLIAGGVASLLLNTALPNFLQKLSLREQLLALGVRIGNLSNSVDSRIRVLIRLERSQLLDLLRSRWTLSPEFTTVVTTCTNGIAQLQARVAALQQLDLVAQGLRNALYSDVPPTLVEKIETLRRKANAFLTKTEPSEADLRDAIAAIAEASVLVDALGEPGEEFGIKLVARVKAVRDVAKAIDTLPSWAAIKAAVPWAWNAVANIDPTAATVPPAQYAQLDGAVRRVEIMQHYAQLRVGRPASGSPELAAQLAALAPAEREQRLERLKQLERHEASMIACLGNPSHGASVTARRLLREIGEEIYSADLKKALTADPPEARIGIEPDIAYERAPLTFCVEFYDQFVNDAAARHDWTCEWDFDDNLDGRGWTVSHYFMMRQPRQPIDKLTVKARVRDADGLMRQPHQPIDKFTVKARVRDADGQPVAGAGKEVTLSRVITVRRSDQGAAFESRVWAEAAKLAAALLIAIFGLVAGAQEQLGRLDIVPGLVAVFLVGFGADTIKNLLTTKS